ncbi:caspase-1-like [Astatotilapia calliptera]|nr:caspase-1-like [Astatotilapia calliptera]
METWTDSQGKKIYPVTQQSQSNRIALLINIETFNTSLYKCRAAKDEKVMQSLLQTLGYEVVRCGDITAKMIDKPLKEFSEHPKLALTDSVFVTLVCYGGTGTEEFEIDQIFQHLNSKNCPALKDKPKIVIIHACRGVGEESVDLLDRTQFVPTDDIESLSVNSVKGPRTHNEKDFIIFHSSTTYTGSYTHETYGSAFIQHICEAVKKHCLRDDIEEIFRTVMQSFEEFPSEQMPTKERDTLTKRFYVFQNAPEEVKQWSAGKESLNRVEPDGVRRVSSDLKKYSYQLTIDPNTVYKWIQLSDSNREVMRLNAQQPYPDHPERFDRPQLLCTDGLTGPCYWEVEWSGYVSIAVSYKGIKRRGHSDDCLFGLNSQSWSLDCSYSYSVLHNNTETFIPKDVVSNRVAVYVGHPAGTLSFYNIFLDSLIHLHTFNTTFTEPLYPGFGVWSHNSSVRIMKPVHVHCSPPTE